MSNQRNTSSGFTLIEVLTVCAIVGVLALIAYPNMVRFKEQQQTKEGVTQMAGVLDEARSRATSEATPYLVYFNEDSVGGGGNCEPAATMVRDSDHTYSITEGDEVRDVTLPEDSCKKVKKVKNDGDESNPALPDLLLPIEDTSTRAAGLELGGEEEESEEDSSGQGSGKEKKAKKDKKTVSNARVADAVVNGATFPIDEESGRPVIAFSERGIPVDPADPTSWGSGAGAIYMTDGHSTVYAAIVQPLGNVQLRVFDNVTGEWR